SRIGRQLPVLVSSRGIASNRVSLAADHFSDATDLTALPFDQLPTTFFIALPFLHRLLIVGGETWQRRGQDIEKEKKRGRTRKRKREDERENESGERDRATKMEGRLYGAARGEEPLSVESRRVASGRITRDIHALSLPRL
ncbi:Uncharacterized protein DBV15_01204, partial [Temnothorax longispinosus]